MTMLPNCWEVRVVPAYSNSLSDPRIWQVTCNTARLDNVYGSHCRVGELSKEAIVIGVRWGDSNVYGPVMTDSRRLMM